MCQDSACTLQTAQCVPQKKIKIWCYIGK